MSVSRLLPRPRLIAAAWCLAGLPARATPSVEYAWTIEPRQKNVEYDRPGGDVLRRCTINQEKIDGVSMLVVRGPGGEILRSFADTNGNRVVDRWSFYKDGVEVYRDVDTDHDTKSDQSRWLNSAGTRVAVNDEDTGVITGWREMSPEEATAELVNALRDRDLQAFTLLLPTRAELEAAGFSGDRLGKLAARAARAAEQFPRFAATQTQVNEKSRWSGMLVPQGPGVIPAGGDVTRDVTAYDNVVALVETPGTGGGGTGRLFVGSLIRCGKAWKPIDLPQVLGPGGDIAAADGFFGKERTVNDSSSSTSIVPGGP